MTRIWTGCENLLQPMIGQMTNILREDTAVTIEVSSVSTLLISANASRESLKIFVASLSSNAELWLRFGLNASVENTAFKLPLESLFLFTAVELPQIKGPISAITTTGTALVRVCSA